MLDLRATFKKHRDEYRKFERVEQPLHPRPDLCAFLLLDRLDPDPGCDLISAAEHDEFFLNTDCEVLSKVATEDDILMLVRCGVRYSAEYDCLAMLV